MLLVRAVVAPAATPSKQQARPARATVHAPTMNAMPVGNVWSMLSPLIAVEISFVMGLRPAIPVGLTVMKVPVVVLTVVTGSVRPTSRTARAALRTATV